jgi:RNA-binding motif X-linked protein 2
MNSIKSIARLNEAELQNCTPPNASWHTDYRDTAYIHIGGLPFELSEGDVLLIFSQYGNPVHINLVRDKDTGKSRGFAFLKYEDQRSTDLAVDNLSGAGVLGRVLSVDHARYKMKEGERETVGEDEDEVEMEGADRWKRRRTSESGSEGEEEARPMIKEEVELQQLLREHDEDDPMKAYLVQEKRAEVEEALKAVTISKSSKVKDEKHRHKHRHHHSRRDDSSESSEERTNGHRSRRKDGRGKEEQDGSPRRSRDIDREETTNGQRSRRERESHGDDDRKHRRKRSPSSSSSEATDKRTQHSRDDGDANFLNSLSRRGRKED